MKQKILFFMWLLPVVFTEAQVKKQLVNSWRVELERKDGKHVVFRLERTQEDGKIVLYVINAAERIKITSVKTVGDSMFFAMPAFESSFRVKFVKMWVHSSPPETLLRNKVF